MNTKKHQSVAPFYAVGALWVLAGLALPLYRLHRRLRKAHRRGEGGSEEGGTQEGGLHRKPRA